MKKFIILFFLVAISFNTFANTTKFTETDKYMICDVNVDNENFEQTKDFYDFLYEVIQKSQNTNKKVVIRQNGKWKYVLPTSESKIAADVITSHLTSGATFKSKAWYASMKKVFDIMKNDGNILVTIK